MEQNKRQTKLSPNQKSALAALAEGLTVAEIADEWEVSQTVVYRNIEQAGRKLGAKTIPHAVALWLGMQVFHAPSRNGHQPALAANGKGPG
jgi:DNA-binding NarL/FixJ family response regulator